MYRSESRRVLATLIRLVGDFDHAEEAMQDAFAAAVEQWPQTGVPANPRAWYFCDPVMGAASGCKVEPGIQEFLVRTMPEVADAMAPNHTELQRLVGREIETLEEAVTACREVIARGPKLVLVKHLLDRNSPADRHGSRPSAAA